MDYWKNVKINSIGQTGGQPKFDSPEKLWQACCSYFEYIDNHPLLEEKVNFYEGIANYATVSKMRPYTIKGLCIFIGVNEKYFIHARKHPQFTEVCECIDNIIHTQKFEGGMAGFFNATLVSRDLGLVERQEVATEHSVNNDQASQFTDMLTRLAERVADDRN